MRKVALFLVFFVYFFKTNGQDVLVLHSGLIQRPDTVLIFKPLNINNTTEKLPMVILLHGYQGNHRQWSKIIDLQKVANDFGFLIVCPDGFYSSWYINSPLKKDSQYESFFFKKLLPALFSKYNINASNVFISGLSMGGHGALYLFLQQPDLFNAAGSTSGALDLRNSGVQRLGLTELIGSFTPENKNWEKFSVINNLYKIQHSNKKIIVDCGTSDSFLKTNDVFAQKCKDLKINVLYQRLDGKHDSKYWNKAIQFHFIFFYENCIR